MTKVRKLLVTLFCAWIVLSPALAEARAGGSARSGGSMGYSSQGSRGSRTWDNNDARPMERSITPQQRPASPGVAPPVGAQPSFAQRHPFLTGLAGGFLGSWLGSLLFPHWGMGYGGWGFGGMIGSLFSWLLIIGLVWMVFRMFRRRGGMATVPSFGGMGYEPPQQQGYSYAGSPGAAAARSSDVPITETDYAAFEAILKAVQGAWSKGDLGTLRHYVTPEMLSYFAEQLAGNSSQGVENHVDNVELIKGDVREAWDEGNMQYATADLQWRANDYTVRTDRKPGEPGYVVKGDPQRPSEAREMWTFARRPGGHWLLSAIQQV